MWFMEDWFIPRGWKGGNRFIGSVCPREKNKEYNLSLDVYVGVYGFVKHISEAPRAQRTLCGFEITRIGIIPHSNGSSTLTLKIISLRSTLKDDSTLNRQRNLDMTYL